MNGLKLFVKTGKFVAIMVQKIKTIPHWEQLRLSMELTCYIGCSLATQSGSWITNQQRDEWRTKQKTNKVDILMEILDICYTLNAPEKQIILEQVSYLLETKAIKGQSYLGILWQFLCFTPSNKAIGINAHNPAQQQPTQIITNNYYTPPEINQGAGNGAQSNEHVTNFINETVITENVFEIPQPPPAKKTWFIILYRLLRKGPL